MNLIEDEVDKYIRNAISEDVDIELDRNEVIYKKYNINGTGNLMNGKCLR